MRRRLARKVAQKYLGRGLRDQMQVSLSSARVRLDELDGMVARGVALVDGSEQREHIYKEAGDMITRFQSALRELREHLALLSYVVNQMAASSAAEDLNPAERKQLDRLMESAARYTDPQTLQGIPTHLEEVPEALKRDKADEGSIYDVERADDVAKRQRPSPEVIDYSGFSTYVVKPDVKPGDVP